MPGTVVWCRCPYDDGGHLHGSWCTTSISEEVKPLPAAPVEAESSRFVPPFMRRFIPARVKSPVADNGWR